MLAGQGNLAMAHQEPAQAFVRYLNALSLHRESDDELGVAAAHQYLARASLAAGKPERAMALLRPSINFFASLDDHFSLTLSCRDLARALTALDKAEETNAARVLAWWHAAAIGHPLAQQLAEHNGSMKPPSDDDARQAYEIVIAAMLEVLAEIRERVLVPEGRADLYTALMAMAAIDPWGHNLQKEISAMLQVDDLEILKLSPTLRGAFEDGERNVLRALFAAQAGRAPTPDEQEALLKRVYELGPEGTLGAVLKLHGEALAVWLLGPAPAAPHAG